MHDVFYILPLEQNITKKEHIDKTISQIEFDEDNDNGIYKVEVIKNSRIYAKESLKSHLPGLYYLISWKN